MKYLKIILLSFFILSCEGGDGYDPTINFETISNLHAPVEGGQGLNSSGPFTKFDFETSSETNSETNWDIAFRGTSLIINGGSSLNNDSEPERNGNAGAYIFNGSLAALEIVDENLFTQDSEQGYAIQTGSGNGWYNYTGSPYHLILPIPGRILVFRTRNNGYAKVEVLSYYFDAPENPDAFDDESRYYTFNYVYQSEPGNTSFN
mgnify:FL=1